MRAIESIVCTAMLLLMMSFTGATAQEISPAEEGNGFSFFESESPHAIEDILDRLSEPAEEGVQPLEELLRPANTNSPRDTIVSFVKLTQRYYDLLVQDTYTPEDVAELQHIYDEMQWFFDLRNVAPSLRQDVAVNSAVYLREIIDRIGLPSLEEIPDREQMLDAVQEGYAPSWKIGSSPLEIVRIDDGPNQGKYLFSEETFETVEDLFWQLRSFPYRTRAAEGFYEASFLTPSPTLQAWTDRLPAWTQNGFLGQTVWQWIAMVALFVLAMLAIWLLSSWLRRLTRNVTPLKRDSTLLLVPLFAILVSYLLYDLIGETIFITGVVFQAAVYIIYGIGLIGAIILIFSLGTVMCDLAASTERAKRHPSEIHLVILGIRIVSIIAIIAVVLQGMHLVGFSLATILAGAGVTGLAVALAAQNTLRNVFGSLMLLLDKPFEVGQRIKLRDYDGVVEDIGMRSTRLRLLSGHLVSIPNENVAGMDIENIDMRPSIRRTFNISLAYDTSLEKIQRTVTILREILSVPTDDGVSKSHGDREARTGHPNEAINHPDHPPRVAFSEISSNALNIAVTYWYSPPDYGAYLEHCEKINQDVVRRLRDEGIQFTSQHT